MWIMNCVLTSKIVRSIFCSCLKFGRAILVRVLCLIFETSCINRPLHNEHKNIKKSFIKKRLYTIFGQKQN